jgi:hypothetical protein
VNIIPSSTIADAKYDEATKVLLVTFHSGATYAYKDVPPDTAQSFLASDSRGAFLHAQIKNRGFPTTRIK